MHESYESIKELLNQCEFRKAIRAIDEISGSVDSDVRFSLQLLKSQALFEMHNVSEAYQLLAQVIATTPRESEEYLYVVSRVAYLDRDYQKAEQSFRELAQKAECVTYYYRALIGLANTFYTLKRYPEVHGLLPELEELCDSVPLDSVLSYKLLKANLYHGGDGQIIQAESLLYEVMTEAIRFNWKYFVAKAIYSLAKISQSQGKMEILRSQLKLLQCYLDPNEAVFMTFLVNDQFKDEDCSLEAPLKFDGEHKRVGLRGDWIPLHDKPLLYNFMDKLYHQGTFVTKQDLARHLWPDQEYVAKSHDPRIFDIARRVRGLIEKYEDQPVYLLSGRQGYKLACKDAGEPYIDQAADESSDQIDNGENSSLATTTLAKSSLKTLTSYNPASAVLPDSSVDQP